MSNRIEYLYHMLITIQTFEGKIEDYEILTEVFSKQYFYFDRLGSKRGNWNGNDLDGLIRYLVGNGRLINKI